MAEKHNMQLAQNEKLIKSVIYATKKNKISGKKTSSICSEIIVTNKRLIHEEYSKVGGTRTEVPIDRVSSISTNKQQGKKHFPYLVFFISLIIALGGGAVIYFYPDYTLYAGIGIGAAFLLFIFRMLFRKRSGSISIVIYSREPLFNALSITTQSRLNKSSRKNQLELQSINIKTNITADGYKIVDELGAIILNIKQANMQEKSLGSDVLATQEDALLNVKSLDELNDYSISNLNLDKVFDKDTMDIAINKDSSDISIKENDSDIITEDMSNKTIGADNLADNIVDNSIELKDKSIEIMADDNAHNVKDTEKTTLTDTSDNAHVEQAITPPQENNREKMRAKDIFSQFARVSSTDNKDTADNKSKSQDSISDTAIKNTDNSQVLDNISMDKDEETINTASNITDDISKQAITKPQESDREKMRAKDIFSQFAPTSSTDEEPKQAITKPQESDREKMRAKDIFSQFARVSSTDNKDTAENKSKSQDNITDKAISNDNIATVIPTDTNADISTGTNTVNSTDNNADIKGVDNNITDNSQELKDIASDKVENINNVSDNNTTVTNDNLTDNKDVLSNNEDNKDSIKDANISPNNSDSDTDKESKESLESLHKINKDITPKIVYNEKSGELKINDREYKKQQKKMRKEEEKASKGGK